MTQGPGGITSEKRELSEVILEGALTEVRSAPRDVRELRFTGR